jgi:hypothetical protein
MEGRFGPMERRTRTNRRTRARPSHPYQAFEGSLVWKRVNRAISTLVRNGDIKEASGREYIVGYICKMLCVEKGNGSK